MDHEQDNQDIDYANDIAVVGMACRFPGALNAQDYWDNVRNGVESVTQLSDEQLRRQGVADSVLEDPNYVKSAAVLEKMDQFDPGLFGFGSLEAAMMDPQHRQYLECAWEALEHAGHDPAQFDGAIGVFGGSGHNAYMPYNLFTNPEYMNRHGLFLVRHTGNDKDFLTTRVSYCLNLNGPSVNVQTACSTSLVASHLAAQSLLSHECDMALAGGVTIEMPHHRGYLYQEGEILSPDGHCRPFDAGSQGTLFGSGAGVLVLRRMEDALEQGDTIYAVLKASAVNNDGAGKVSYMAPSVDGQAAAIHEALVLADINPETIDYVECHGTGTPIGDPIEIAALTSAYQKETDRKQFCGVGSVKANIGHLDTAAGVASAIKVIQALRHQELPPNINFTAPNPAIDWSSSPFYVNAQCKPWHRDDGPRRAGVSSLGVGGTNAHLIFEEAPTLPATDSHHRDWVLLPLSARSEKSLNKASRRLADFLENNPELPLADVSFTLQTGRSALKERRVLAAKDHAQAARLLRDLPKDRTLTHSAPEAASDVAFMFAGGGAQFPNMGRDLYDHEPVYRLAVDECLQHLSGFIDFDLKSLMYPEPGQEEAAATELERPTRSLTSLFTTQYAQAQLWMSFGIEPSCLIGHSMGENTAACIAGVISLRDALGLVALRGQLFETVPEGGMLSVQCGEAVLRPLLGDELSLACVNAPELSVVSGPANALQAFERTLADQDIDSQRVRINIAAHSSMLEPILKDFGDYLRAIQLSAPKIPLTANLSGDWMTDEQAQDPEYWVAHLRNTVRFADCAEKLLTREHLTLLEVGPGKILSSLCQSNPAKQAATEMVHSMRHPDDGESDQSFMLRMLGALWQAGSVASWQTFWGDERRQRVALPTYAFDHKRYWIEPGDSVFGQGNVAGLTRAESPSDWFYQQTWQRAGRLPADRDGFGRRILVVGDTSQARAFARHAQGRAAVAHAVDGPSLAENDHGFCLPLTRSEAWADVLAGAVEKQEVPTDIVFFVDSGADTNADPVDTVFAPLFALVQALAAEDPEERINLTVVTRGLFAVGAEKASDPGQSLCLGPVRVAHNELAPVNARVIDLNRTDDSSAGWLESLERELLVGAEATDSQCVALRDGQRFVSGFQSISSLSEQPMNLLKDGDTVLVTGGFGGLALVVARQLAQMASLNIVLVSRRQVPDPSSWPELAAGTGPLAMRYQALTELASKANVMHMVADVASSGDITALGGKIRDQFGPVAGIVHTAGVIDDALIQLKDLASARRVLAPKVQGTRLLDQAFSGGDLKFFVAFSSISAFSGLPGQVDYAAANAFLDSYCANRDGANGTAYTAINWPAWRQVGMAASIADGSATELAASGEAAVHPLLGHQLESGPERHVFVRVYSPETDWILDEHRIKNGEALIPGAGYIEIARAAFAEVTGVETVSMADVFFMAPFFVADGQRRALRVTLELAPDRSGEFSIESEFQGEWTEHCRGEISGSAAGAIDAESRGTIAARCQQRTQRFDDPDHHPHLDFGPRWASLKAIHLGESEALEEIDLGEFAQDLDHYKLHPAMLDMATAGAQALIPGYQPDEELYVPVGYQNLTYLGGTASRWFSHVRYQPQAASEGHEGGTVTFDVIVTSEAGDPLLLVKNFTMQRVDQALSGGVPDRELDPALKRTLELGISPKEGATAFDLVLRHAGMPQVAVSAFDLEGVIEELGRGGRPGNDSTGGSSAPSHDADADPDIPAIEAAVLDHEAIEAAVVRSHLDEDDNRRLIAHFVVDPDEYITVSDLRRHLKRQLDPSLLPQHLIELDEMPLDSKGKLNRLELVDPFAPVDRFQAPETSSQKQIAAIWQDVLDVGRVGVDENFFDLGGHSLLSIRAITKTNKKFGVQLNQAIMALQTLEQIAHEVDTQRGVDPTIEDDDSSDDLSPATESAGDSVDSPRRGLVRSMFGGQGS